MSRAGKLALFAGGVLALAISAFFLLFPQLGAYLVRSRILPRIEDRLDRRLAIGEIKVGYGSLSLKDVAVTDRQVGSGPPLATASRISIDFQFWPALIGDVRLGTLVIEEPRVDLRRAADGSDNFSDLVARLRSKGDPAEPAAEPGRRRLLPARVRVERGWMAFADERRGLKGGVDVIDATCDLTGARVVVANLTGAWAEHRLGPRASASALEARADLSDPLRTLAVTISGGSAAVSKNLSLSAIAGRIAAGDAGKAEIALAGSYGGATEILWQAEGWLGLDGKAGEVHLRADSFTLDKIQGILAGTPIKAPGDTAIDASLDVALTDGIVTYNGGLNLTGLTIDEPNLAEEPVKDLGFRGTIRGSYALGARRATLDELAVSFRGIEVKLDGEVALVGGLEDDGQLRAEPRVRAHLVVPAVPCQAMLKAIPPELVPRLLGFNLKGTFSTDVSVIVDWADLDALELDGSVGIFGCKAVDVPEEFEVERLMGEFEHVVEVEENDFMTFVVGPSNPDFVPYYEVSPYLINSLMTTEDSGFMKHRGFIVREFRSALIDNLKAGRFKRGASSITMQLVKNVFLYRQKTLSRKLQELFLTWYIETVLPKERILEMYVNVIEFGPGIYGIGPAARQYFGKLARDLNPVEAAFFSSILPNPKQRYLQYCEGALKPRWDDKVQRILKITHERERLTDEEYAQALETPLVFDRTFALPENECKRKVLKMIQNTRPTAAAPRGG